ncbi:hypothetical protein FIU83_09285 [Halomonas sp. THAF5a]|uniref:hypothetical protein n=1 Tax=Halomonas sp. THAF5a TaxID=2587844 RepID=UPI0012686DC9|nr:hypothetical protein [Halomonas sp. THAF5a]QFU01832.1 hypothetical protein FIU83_09285 [Halomonas sp. THAF5a]
MPRLLIATVALAMLGGCTTYTWEDGRQETVWGVPAEDTTMTPEEREAQGVQYRIPGEPPR